MKINESGGVIPKISFTFAGSERLSEQRQTAQYCTPPQPDRNFTSTERRPADAPRVMRLLENGKGGKARGSAAAAFFLQL